MQIYWREKIVSFDIYSVILFLPRDKFGAKFHSALLTFSPATEMVIAKPSRYAHSDGPTCVCYEESGK